MILEMSTEAINFFWPMDLKYAFVQIILPPTAILIGGAGTTDGDTQEGAGTDTDTEGVDTDLHRWEAHRE
jgi:hypothetical protein